MGMTAWGYRKFVLLTLILCLNHSHKMHQTGDQRNKSKHTKLSGNLYVYSRYAPTQRIHALVASSPWQSYRVVGTGIARGAKLPSFFEGKKQRI